MCVCVCVVLTPSFSVSPVAVYIYSPPKDLFFPPSFPAVSRLRPELQSVWQCPLHYHWISIAFDRRDSSLTQSGLVTLPLGVLPQHSQHQPGSLSFWCIVQLSHGHPHPPLNIILQEILWRTTKSILNMCRLSVSLRWHFTCHSKGGFIPKDRVMLWSYVCSQSVNTQQNNSLSPDLSLAHIHAR